MDFYQHQERARHKTRLLLFYFVASIVGIVLAIYLPVVLLLGGGAGGPADATLWDPGLFGVVTAGVLAIVGVGSAVRFVELGGSGVAVAESLGGRLISGDAPGQIERKILNVVEEMAIASGVPTPDVYLLDGEEGINAFAAGLTPAHAVVGVTRGCVERLNRDELQGVIAHEFSHILNGDMRLNLRLIGLVSGILALAMLGRILLRSSGGSASSGSSTRRGTNLLPLFGLVLLLVGYVGVFFGRLIRSAVSRQREFLADASAVQFTRNPDGIAGALKRIGALELGSLLATPNAEEASHMLFGDGLRRSFLNLFATHPPLIERIRAIDPAFDGDFRRVTPRPGPAAPVPPAPGEGLTPAARFPVVVGQTKLGPAIAGALAALPAPLIESGHQPLTALGLVLGLVLAREDDVRARQITLVGRELGAEVEGELRRMLPSVDDLDERVRLPLLDRAITALRRLSAAQHRRFRQCLDSLIAMDGRIDLFEFALVRLLERHLDACFMPETTRAAGAGARVLDAFLPDITTLVAALARGGATDPAAVDAAYRRGMAYVTDAPTPLADGAPDVAAAPSLEQVRLALDRLARAAPSLKKIVLRACAETVLSDREVSPREREMLRAIAEGLGCPVPPLAA